ncbi:exopolysaccharide biosynthesis protein [uncultured Gilvimarinus sp.]|uniref:exopolysaccharide biosynthesis protein n=1 Tax=uncultured Gilvimarinus sp. TaxID=1689143 RepID=UPI0030EED39B
MSNHSEQAAVGQDNLTGTIDLIEESGSGETLSVGDILSGVKGRGFGPLLLLPALITLLPTGGIPGVPIVAAILIVLIAGQLLAGASRPWIPQRLARANVSRQRFTKLLDKSRPVTRRIDRAIKPRYGFMTGDTGNRVIAVIAIVLALSLIPLGPIPFAAAIPSGIMVLLALGLVARDGLLIILGLILSAIAGGWLVIRFI